MKTIIDIFDLCNYSYSKVMLNMVRQILTTGMIYTHLKLQIRPVRVQLPGKFLRDVPSWFHFWHFPTQCNRVILQEGVECISKFDLFIVLGKLVQTYHCLFQGMRDSTMVTMAGRLFRLMASPFSRRPSTT